MKNFIISGIIIAITACSTIDIISDYDRDADFSQYLTFQMAPPQDDLPKGVVINKLNGQRIRKAIIKEMTDRGYEQAPSGDLVVNVYVKVKTRTEKVTTYDGPYFPYRYWYWYYGYWGFYNYWGPGWRHTTTTILEYDEGTLIVDLVDTRTDRLVWHGVATGNPDRFKKNPEEKINELIKEMFKEYPYRAGDNTPRIMVKN